VAKELGIGEQTLDNWVHLEKIDHGEREGLSTGDRDEMAKSHGEVERLTMERALLRRFVAFWVKEQDR
jgi:transposase